jgi:hypothetical protein
MDVYRYDDIHEFYPIVEPFLTENEAAHNLMLGVSSLLLTGVQQFSDPAYLGLVAENDEVLAVAMRTPPHYVVLSQTETLPAVARFVADIQAFYGDDVPGVLGPTSPSLAFAGHWTALTGKDHAVRMDERVYQAKRITPPEGVPGATRLMEWSDVPLMKGWLGEFFREALAEDNPAQVDRVIASALDRDHPRKLLLWIDESGTPVSLAGCTGPTPNGMRIGPVYTPPEFRGRGYGSAVTAALSQMILDEGKTYCFLFTDLSNPTSNTIYQRIGYEPVTDIKMIAFDLPE